MLTVAEALDAVLEQARALPPAGWHLLEGAGLRDWPRTSSPTSIHLRSTRRWSTATRCGRPTCKVPTGGCPLGETITGGPNTLSVAGPARGGRHHDGCADSAGLRRGRDARADSSLETGCLVLEPAVKSRPEHAAARP